VNKRFESRVTYSLTLALTGDNLANDEAGGTSGGFVCLDCIPSLASVLHHDLPVSTAMQERKKEDTPGILVDECRR
jgi:hypothetical protein